MPHKYGQLSLVTDTAHAGFVCLCVCVWAWLCVLCCVAGRSSQSFRQHVNQVNAGSVGVAH